MSRFGHVVLDGKEYVCRMQPAPAASRHSLNQMAAKFSQGAGDYEDLSEWDVLTLNASSGIGKVTADEGVLFSTLETRYPDRVLLPARLTPVPDTMPDGMPPKLDTSTTVVRGSGSVRRIAVSLGELTAGTSISNIVVWVPEWDDVTYSSGSYEVAIYSDSGGLPGSSLGSTGFGTRYPSKRPGHYWLKETFPLTVPSTANYWLVLRPNLIDSDASFTIDGYSNGINAKSATYDGNSWTLVDNQQLFVGYVSVIAYGQDFDFGQDSKLIEFNDKLHVVTRTNVYSYNSTTETWSNVLTRAAAVSKVSDCAVWNNDLYIAASNTGSVEKVTTAYSSSLLTGIVANGLITWNGYLVRWYNNSFYYTADGTTWTQVEVGPADYDINGMSYMGDYLYISTDDALYENTNDWNTQGIAPWPGPDDDAGRGMCHWRGNIYIPYGTTIYRYDQSGAFFPMGPDREGGLPVDYNGKISKLIPTNNYLIALIDARWGSATIKDDQKASLWAWDGTGWHYIASVSNPNPYFAIYDAVYIRDDLDQQTLYLGHQDQVFSVDLPDSISYYRPAYEPEYSGWMETDWWQGRLAEVTKDMESVYFNGENSDSAVTIYYQTDDDTTWAELGTFTGSGTYLRWDDLDTRPTPKRFKLGVLMKNVQDTFTENTVQAIRAIIARYQPMVADRYAWGLQIVVEDGQRMADDRQNDRTVAGMVTHLDSLIKRDKPFIFKDIDGVQYEVKIADHTRAPYEFDYTDADGNINSFIYSMTLHQTHEDIYSA